MKRTTKIIEHKTKVSFSANQENTRFEYKRSPALYHGNGGRQEAVDKKYKKKKREKQEGHREK